METLTCIALARELDRMLSGMQIVLAEQADAGETLLLQLLGRSSGGSGAKSGWLTMSSCLHDAVMFFHEKKPALTERAWPAPLSEHLERMHVESVSHGGMDRVIAVKMSSSPGGAGGPSLHVELFSRRLRAYLTEAGTGRVIGAHAARRETGARSSEVEVAYSPPAPPLHRLDPLKAGAPTIRDRLPPDPEQDDLVAALFGVGRTLAREVLARSAAGSLDPAGVLKEMLARAVEAVEPIEGHGGGFVVLSSRGDGTGEAQGPAAGPGADEGAGATAGVEAHGAGRGARAAGASAAAASPSGAGDEVGAGAPMALAFEPSSLPHARVVRYPTVNDAVRCAFTSCRKLALDIDRRRAAAKRIHAGLKRTTKTRIALLEELAEAERAGEYRLKGELILAHMGTIPKGASEVELPHSDAPGGALRVGLDPRLSAPANAQAYFKRARKLGRKLSALPARIEALERKEAKLRDELSEVNSGQGPTAPAGAADPAIPAAPAGAAATGTRPQPRRRARDRWPTGIAPRRFLSSDGWTIYVGRNNRENDYLTFAFAKADDLWFHAHGVAGSHVVLRREGRKDMPSRRCVAEAAAVAAYHSKGRTSQTVAVVYTEKKYVRKPRKGKPGAALYSHEKTVMVAPALPPGGGPDDG
jgi:predicted ribosome quality control (RQC) complex YloA/Tae2 family protein